MIIQAVQRLLLEDDSISQVVTDRVHFAERPIKTPTPAIVLTRGPSSIAQTLKKPAGFTVGSVNVNVLTPTYLTAADLARKVDAVLNGFTGKVPIVDEDETQMLLQVDYLKNRGETDLGSEHRDGEGQIATHGIEVEYGFSIQNTLTPAT